MFVSAIIVAAGQCRRFKGKASKVLLKLNSKSVIAYPLEALNRHAQIKEIIIVGNFKNIKELRSIARREDRGKPTRIVLGGFLRQDSVRSGLRAVNSKADFVLIHDAARPFITKDLISAVIKEARETKAAILGMPLMSTIKRVGDKFLVKETIDRNNLWEIQTPQVFKKDLILKAYEECAGTAVTDDAMLVERLGAKVKVVLGSHNNIKITTPKDLVIAKELAKLWKYA